MARLACGYPAANRLRARWPQLSSHEGRARSQARRNPAARAVLLSGIVAPRWMARFAIRRILHRTDRFRREKQHAAAICFSNPVRARTLCASPSALAHPTVRRSAGHQRASRKWPIAFKSANRCRHHLVRHHDRSRGFFRHRRRNAPPAHRSHRKNCRSPIFLRCFRSAISSSATIPARCTLLPRSACRSSPFSVPPIRSAPPPSRRAAPSFRKNPTAARVSCAAARPIIVA